MIRDRRKGRRIIETMLEASLTFPPIGKAINFCGINIIKKITSIIKSTWPGTKWRDLSGSPEPLLLPPTLHNGDEGIIKRYFHEFH